MTQLSNALHFTSTPLSLDQQRTLEQLLAGSSDQAVWWIAGFAAGQAALRGPDAAPKAAPVAGKRLTIAYGSQTGNAKTAASQLAAQAEAQGLSVRLVNLADYTLAELGKERFLAIAISTQGDGDPPDDARIFLKQLGGARAPKLDQLRYTVLALGDSSYPKFCEIGRQLDARLAELGADALSARADADLDIEIAAQPWRDAAVTAAVEAIGQSAATITVLRPASPAPAQVVSSASAVVYANQRLTSRDSELDVRHIELGVGGTDLHYQPGDSLQVRVHNPDSLIDEFLLRSGLAGDTPVECGGRSDSLREILRSQRELTRLSLPLLNAVFAAHPEHPLRQSGTAVLDTHQVPDLLAAGRIDWDAARWVAALATLKPRAYSIASSQAAVADEVHLTVALRRDEVAGIERLGLASGHLAALAEGAEIEVSVEANPRFRLPADASRDLIMIGPGTGVAPFRAFLQQRVADGANGRHWLFFGHRHLRREFLYQTEWLSALKRGQLQRLDVAFSRDQPERRYVQHVLAEQARELVSWIDNGAHLYVCGDAKRMARDVEQALIESIARIRGIDAEAASDELDALASAGRFQRDVY